jgi:acetyl-CoA carboxylase carboxyltransferase component
MTKQAALALSGPPVVEAAIGEDLTADELGGP